MALDDIVDMGENGRVALPGGLEDTGRLDQDCLSQYAWELLMSTRLHNRHWQTFDWYKIIQPLMAFYQTEITKG